MPSRAQTVVLVVKAIVLRASVVASVAVSVVKAVAVLVVMAQHLLVLVASAVNVVKTVVHVAKKVLLLLVVVTRKPFVSSVK